LTKARLTFGLLLVTLAFVPVTSQAQWKTPWDYEGPRGADHWSELDSDYAVCNQGKAQSPIDITSAEKADLPPLRFEFKSGPLKNLLNNGKTVRVDYHGAESAGDILTVGDKTYQLTQFHFHHPGEEALHGKRYQMVVHLMYKSSDGKVVGVAVPVQAGRPNATVQKLWNHMPVKESKMLADYSHPGEEVPGVEIDPGGLLPRSLGYYTYMGAVTAPPCTEDVRWYVLKTPVEMSAKQIRAFAVLFPNDARPVQPVNGRLVQESR
jgi:carbonic anhydrase